MKILPNALAPLGLYPQFIVYKLVPESPLKTRKIPMNPHTLQTYPKGSGWQDDPAMWAPFQVAAEAAESLGPGHGVGFLFTAQDPFFFIDIDDCSEPGGGWNQTAQEICAAVNGAAIEVSQSGRGLHAFGMYSGTFPDHSHDTPDHHLGFYTDHRFVALTGNNAVGNIATDHSLALCNTILPKFYPPKSRHSYHGGWTEHPAPEWRGTDDDKILIRRAIAAKSARDQFDGVTGSFKALWECDENRLSELYPDHERGRMYNESNADMALAQHLAFWTGNNCERILRLMLESGLNRDKWTARDDYLTRTILNAVSMQFKVYGTPKLHGAYGEIKAAERIRSERLRECNPEQVSMLLNQKEAKWWIDNHTTPISDLVAKLTPVTGIPEPPSGSVSLEPEFRFGHQLLGAEQQAGHFKGCVYIQENHRVFIPSGALLKSEQFNATYGGYAFQIDDGTGKSTRKAFEAFTESQCVRFPKADGMCFRPREASGALIEQDGAVLVNTYVPVNTPRTYGDAGPFLRHLEKILPDPHDQTILLSYMAALVQHKGVKFYWAPLIQGTFGNGKSLFSTCMVQAIGAKYSHMPPAKEIDEKFNSWLFNKIFIGVEDIYVPDRKQELIEILKPMITGEWTAKRAMQQEQVMKDMCANFIFNTNHKDAIRKTHDDRRFCVFFSAQQSHSDIVRDGMGGEYFPNLYAWLRGGGYAIVTDYLYRYEIPDEFNPAGSCHRAPVTSTTHEAVAQGLGSIEQEIIEAIEEGRPGFRGGWISSMALDTLLKLKRKDGAIPINRRRDMLRSLGYDWHPALNNGRVNNAVMPDNGKPKLFIQTGHGALLITSGAEVAKAYESAQAVGI